MSDHLTLPSEVWKDIPGYEGYYQASSLGRIKSLSRFCQRNPTGYTSKERILKPQKLRTGHLYVNLMSGTKAYIHRLILESFVGPCPKGMECRHFPDQDPMNNKLENLSWTTRKKNTKDRIHNGTYGKNSQSKKS